MSQINFLYKIVFIFFRTQLLESKIEGRIFFFIESLIYINPVPLGPLKYFLPDPTITSQLIFFTSIFICPID